MVEEITALTGQWGSQGVRYERAVMLDHFWKDMHRPELFWRTFKPITGA